MLIICPSCATSYMIDPASMPKAGRTVRCARCKTTWFAGGPAPAANGSTPAGGVIVEAESQPAAIQPPQPAAPAAPAAKAAGPEAPADADDFGNEPAQTIGEVPKIEQAAVEAAPAEVNEIPVTDAPSLVPPITQERTGETSAAALDADEVESFAVRRERLRARRKNKRRSSRWTAIILVLVAFNVALVGARYEVVRYLPQTASLFAAIGLPVNLRNLKFENVKISKASENGVTTLIVDGNIVSTGNSPTEVPRLRFSLRNASGQEIYTWTALPSRSALRAGERLDFHSRLAAPPADAVDVMVRFFNAQDAAAVGGK
jgi:predicted Zn finger-like uncharacterized protein